MCVMLVEGRGGGGDVTAQGGNEYVVGRQQPVSALVRNKYRQKIKTVLDSSEK